VLYKSSLILLDFTLDKCYKNITVTIDLYAKLKLKQVLKTSISGTNTQADVYAIHTRWLNNDCAAAHITRQSSTYSVHWLHHVFSSENCCIGFQIL